jgi:hypothetical protein
MMLRKPLIPPLPLVEVIGVAVNVPGAVVPAEEAVLGAVVPASGTGDPDDIVIED